MPITTNVVSSNPAQARRTPYSWTVTFFTHAILTKRKDIFSGFLSFWKKVGVVHKMRWSTKKKEEERDHVTHWNRWPSLDDCHFLFTKYSELIPYCVIPYRKNFIFSWIVSNVCHVDNWYLKSSKKKWQHYHCQYTLPTGHL